MSITERAGKRFDVNGAVGDRSPYKMYYALQMFFANGGGPCWIVSAGDYSTQQVGFVELQNGLNATEKIDEITLYVYPDAQRLTSVDDFYTLFGESMDMCQKLKDRFSVMDIYPDPDNPDFFADVKIMRDKTPNEEDILKYGATYGPNLKTTLDIYYGGEGKWRCKCYHRAYRRRWLTERNAWRLKKYKQCPVFSSAKCYSEHS